MSPVRIDTLNVFAVLLKLSQFLSFCWIKKLLKKKVSMDLINQLQKIIDVYRTVNVDVNL